MPVSPPPYARAGTGFGNRFAFRRQGSAETGKPKASAGLNSKAQSQERLSGRQPYGSVPLQDDLTEWRNAETVRLIDRKPAVPERNKGPNRSSPAQRCVTPPISTRTTFGLLLPESAFSCAWHTACGRWGRPGFLIGSIAFPQGRPIWNDVIVQPSPIKCITDLSTVCYEHSWASLHSHSVLRHALASPLLR